MGTPMGVWVSIAGVPDCADFIGFTYLDLEAGVSAKGGSDRTTRSSGAITVRLPWQAPAIALSHGDLDRYGLPPSPDWLEIYGPQPRSGILWGAWRTEPLLRGHLGADWPDDMQVLVHDGGPRVAEASPEIV